MCPLGEQDAYRRERSDREDPGDAETWARFDCVQSSRRMTSEERTVYRYFRENQSGRRLFLGLHRLPRPRNWASLGGISQNDLPNSDRPVYIDCRSCRVWI